MLLTSEVPFTQCTDGCVEFHSPPTDPLGYTVRIQAPVRNDKGELQNLSLGLLEMPASRRLLWQAFLSQNLRVIVAPSVSYMSGVIFRPEQLSRKISFGMNIEMFRPEWCLEDPTELEACDGTEVLEGAAFVMSAAGCLLLVLLFQDRQGKWRFLVAHAGRDSLIDRSFVHHKKRSRKHFSVVDAMVAYARAEGARPEDMILRSFGSLPWRAFVHSPEDPEHGKANEEIYEYFNGASETGSMEDRIFPIRECDGARCLSPSRLVYRQALAHRIGTIHVGKCDLTDEHAYVSQPKTELAGSMRNLVTFIRD